MWENQRPGDWEDPYFNIGKDEKDFLTKLSFWSTSVAYEVGATAMLKALSKESIVEVAKILDAVIDES